MVEDRENGLSVQDQTGVLQQLVSGIKLLCFGIYYVRTQLSDGQGVWELKLQASLAGVCANQFRVRRRIIHKPMLVLVVFPQAFEPRLLNLVDRATLVDVGINFALDCQHTCTILFNDQFDKRSAAFGGHLCSYGRHGVPFVNFTGPSAVRKQGTT